MLNVFIGYDSNETAAYHVCAHSIMKHSSHPVSITPINMGNMRNFKRDKEDGSTEFSFSRFLTPYLAGYKGLALFMDCDILVRCDIAEIFDLYQGGNDVHVVKHDYIPKDKVKFLGNEQHAYPMKNWSSVMLFNCSNYPVRKLTCDSVSKATGKYLHRFEWTTPERIGELPPEYNHLVGEYDPNPNAKIVHFTLGSPCFEGYENQEFADEWYETLMEVNSSASYSDRMPKFYKHSKKAKKRANK